MAEAQREWNNALRTTEIPDPMTFKAWREFAYKVIYETLRLKGYSHEAAVDLASSVEGSALERKNQLGI